MIARRAALLSSLLLAACQPAPATPPAAVAPAGAAIRVAPAVVAGGYRLQEAIAGYDQTSLDHLRVALHRLDGQGAESAAIQSVAVPKGSFGATITFGNLAHQTTYRVRASAYLGASETVGMVAKADSYVDIPVGSDDAPPLGQLKVNLVDRVFAGTATSAGLTVGTGPVVHAGSPTAGVNQPAEPNMVETVATLPASGTVYDLDVAIAPDGTLYLAGGADQTVYRLDGGTPTPFAGGTGPLLAALAYPRGLAADPQGGLRIAEDGALTHVAGGAAAVVAGARGQTGMLDDTGAAARFDQPGGVALAANGDMIVADTANNRIRRVTPGGVVTTIAGQAAAGATDAQGTAAKFNGPGGVAIAPNGDIYVADTFSHKIRRIDASHNVTTFAGTGTPGGSDSNGRFATFAYPEGLAFDAAGYLWVADRSAVRRVRADGQVTTIAGVYGDATSVDGEIADARFMWLTGLAIAAGGDVYVVDRGTRTLRRLYVEAAG